MRRKIFYWYVVFVALYAASFFIPRSISTLQRLELSENEYRLLSLCVLIPLALIWYAAFYGYERLRNYAHLIHDTKDGKHVNLIATGVMVLAFGLPINSLVSAVASIITEHNQQLTAVSTIVKNYVSVIYPLIGFLIIGKGARGLTLLSKQRVSYKAANILAIVFVGISVIFSYLVMRSENLQVIYHLPDWMVLLTIVAPYLYTWYVGLLAAYEIHLYGRNAPGTLYRTTWNIMASGLASIIAVQIIFQFVAIATVEIQNLKVARLLFIVYVLLGLLSIGYLLVAYGAKRLQRIEEV